MSGNQGCDYLFKILLVGNSGVGKSSLLLRFSEDMFSENYISTIGVDFKIRKIEQAGKQIKLQIWDTAGQERFRTITKSYYRGANGIIVVYDVSDRESFESISHWLSEVDKNSTEDVCRLIIGNKCDLPDDKRAVSSEEGQNLAQQHGVPFMETSAKENKNVEDMFCKMTEAMRQKSGANAMNTPQDDKKLNIKGQSVSSKGGCC